MAGAEYPWFLLILIPVFSGLVGWFTNVVAVQMMFKPVDFKGIGPIGWRGIIPANAPKLARGFHRLINEQLLSLREVFAGDEAQRLLDAQADDLARMTRATVDEVAQTHFAPMWSAIADKESVYRMAEGEVRLLSESVLNGVIDDIESYIDVERVVVGTAERDPSITGTIFAAVGRPEFRFIERSGLYFGFLFGLVQLAVWLVYPAWWILPLFGFLVGYATNWAAIKLVFEPREPVRVAGVTFQGLFHKRQHQVSSDFSAMSTELVLTDQALLEQLTSPRSRERLAALVERIVDERFAVHRANPVAAMFLTDELAERFRADAKERVLGELLREGGVLEAIARRSQPIRDTLTRRMSELPPEPFENVLRPAFKQDEWKLILAGAALGLAAGMLQLVYLFGEALAR